MTILVDLSQIISAAILVEGDCKVCAQNPSTQSKSMIKHFIFNSLRHNFMTQKSKYGNMILACDSGSWRYDAFPQYKHQRKLKRESDTSGIKWDFVSEVKNELIEDLDKHFPFIVVKVPKCEGDDVIAVMAKLITEQPSLEEENIFGDTDPEPILIISSDRDNMQLHKFKNVKQWSSIEKKLIKPAVSAKISLLEKIVRGDSGDGIPNLRMSDNTFVDKIRQKPISQKYLDEFYTSSNPIDVCLTEEEKINFKRNELLVSYEMIPQDKQDEIIMCYNEAMLKKHSKMGFYNYLSNNGMNNLLSQIHDFYL